MDWQNKSDEEREQQQNCMLRHFVGECGADIKRLENKENRSISSNLRGKEWRKMKNYLEERKIFPKIRVDFLDTTSKYWKLL
jgi:hypothetical protein